MLGFRSSLKEVSDVENRRLAPFPRLATLDNWQAFPQAFDKYFADRFAFRQMLTTAHHRLLVKVFHRSPIRNVLLAKSGWLFLNGEQGNFVDLNYRNTNPLSGQELVEIQAEMARRRDLVAEWGGKTLFVLVPEKETIYPEYLPDVFQKKVIPGSRYDQWLEIFSRDTSLVHIDLRGTLRAAKAQGILYYRSDSHWNVDGAYLGYREMIRALQRWFPLVSPQHKPAVTRGGKFRGDLAKMLAVGDWFDEPDQSDFVSPQGMGCARPVSPVSGANPIPEKSEPLVFECNNPELPSAVLIRDSMSNRWLPYLPDNFRRLVVMYNWFPSAEVIRRERPDVVIFENVERTLDQFLVVKLGIDPMTGRAYFPWER